MAQKFITVAAVLCVLVAYVQSMPQFQNNPFLNGQKLQPQQYQPQQKQFQPQSFHAEQPQQQSRFLVVDDKFHQNPETKEYNFE